METLTKNPGEARPMRNKSYVNLTYTELIDLALARKEGELASNQALVVKTGTRTGRSPKDRFIVKDAITEDQVEWGAINQPFDAEFFTTLWKKAEEHLAAKDCHFISHLQVGADPTYHIAVTVITEHAWQNLFASLLFIHPTHPKSTMTSHSWTILSVPSFQTDPATDGVKSDAAIILNFKECKVLICGTYYAGEIKKAMFSVLNFLLPAADILPMHCAANSDNAGNTALFFGLSGTGKTTLSADPDRYLIGDDEHGWGKEGIFNFEGGCYAKCIDLSPEREPLIWNAIRYGSIVENVVLDPYTKEPDYSDFSITQNTRAAYPREFIPKRVKDNRGKAPQSLLFLTCDLYGVLPPVAKLSPEQAAYYFLSGYTALVGSTETGQGQGIQPTFSTCFGAPFFPRPPKIYAELLLKRLNEHPTDVFLVNTGWTGGARGEGGKRFSIPTTRAIVSAIVTGQLKNAEYEKLAGFNLDIPKTIIDIDPRILNPRLSWQDEQKYAQYLQLLIEKFTTNFKQFAVSEAIKKAGPTLTGE